VPYSIIWPVILMAIRYVWFLIFPESSKKDGKNVKCDETTGVCTVVTDEQDDAQANSRTTATCSPVSECSDIPAETPFFGVEMDWNEIVSSKKVTIMKFTAKWCKPCKSIDPLVNTLRVENSSKAAFYNVDVDDHMDIAAENGALTIPLLVAFKDGKSIGKYAGSDHTKIKNFVNEVLQ